MGYYYDSRRKKYAVRVSVEGQRLYLGSTTSKKKAIEMEDSYLKKLAKLRKHTLETHKLRFEPQDSGIRWLKPFRKWMAERKKARGR